ncbi:MAG: mannose-6-phosphate isomerase, class I [Elusimicrobia bacterium]|nr:mannose-6-phosphate isomerase, class I [Elusimicrobiota bacterium]
MLSTPIHLKPVFRLVPSIQHYDWGGRSFIPSLLGNTNLEGRPFAELWMGAHPTSPSFVHPQGADPLGLDDLIGNNPEQILGHETLRDFGGLPYLLKILDVEKPLSIQVHPGRDQARAGYEDEEARNVPPTAPDRNYKDPFPKPELVVALGYPFWALAGFRSPSEIKRILAEEPELVELSARFVPTTEGLQQIYQYFMGASQDEVNKFLVPLLARWEGAHRKVPFSRENPRYWALKAQVCYSPAGGADRGLLSFLLMNLVKLNPEEGLFLEPGEMHAFLEGQAIEISACSDNVLRGGLTRKHVDVPQLLKLVTFDHRPPQIVRKAEGAPQEYYYPTSATEFDLRFVRFPSKTGGPVSSSWGSRILFFYSGSGTLSVQGEKDGFSFRQGDSFFIPRGQTIDVRSNEETVYFQAGTPEVNTFRGRVPTKLAFGTSGLRGRIEDITDLEAYVNTRGFLRWVRSQGDIGRKWRVPVGIDLRPSSPRIAQAVAKAIEEEGSVVENVGHVPSPALMFYGVSHCTPSVMVTGSHSPFDRNGIKFNLPDGEVMKEHEQKILSFVNDVRAQEYNRPRDESPFDDRGFFKPGLADPLPIESSTARSAYLQRHIDFFPANGLGGMRILVYQHSAVGRDLLVEILRSLGADVVAVGRSDTFVPIDTEDISAERLEDLQRMAADAVRTTGPIDALVSTDGDSDRPLVCGVQENGQIVFFSGDIVGPLVAEYLGAAGVVVPISVNDGVDLFLKGKVLPRTRIGSPYVIEGMRSAPSDLSPVVGYEANGGFLLNSAIQRNGRSLAPLSTRDAVLPILCVLLSARERGLSVVQLFDRLPRRFTKAGLLDNFPKENAFHVLGALSPARTDVVDVDFERDGKVVARNSLGWPVALDETTVAQLRKSHDRLESVFSEERGFGGGIRRMNFLDGLRLSFGNNDVAHVRPSGNAPQLRIYACADTPQRASEIVEYGLREPDGYLRVLEKKFGPPIK